eukprot:NODE_572_length_5896_cov_0.685872.p2 type:complete len:397 gc:universal NODE_572_length_5896_cov_0.685872:1346-2536(+)
MSLHHLTPLQVIQMSITQPQIDSIKRLNKPASNSIALEVGSPGYAQELIKYWESIQGSLPDRLKFAKELKNDVFKGYSIFTAFANLSLNAGESLTSAKSIHEFLTYAKLNAQPFTESMCLIVLLKLYRTQPMLGYSLLEKYSKKDELEWQLPTCFTTCPSTLSARFYYYGSWYLGTVGRISLALKWIQEGMRLVPIPSEPKIETPEDGKDAKGDKSSDSPKKKESKPDKKVAKTEADSKKEKGDAMDIDAVPAEKSPIKPRPTSLFKVDKEAHKKGRNGFLLACTKLLISCHLLMGDIPEKIIFKQVHDKSNPLFYYKEICKAIKFGDMQSYSSTLKNNIGLFEDDYTFSFMLRLKPAVRKSAIKSIMNVYSCISLKDMATMITNMSSSSKDGILF